MNWKLLGNLVVVLIILSSLIMAFIFYVRHWADRQKSFVKSINITQGLFFKRYIPPSLYFEYDKEKISSDSLLLRYLKTITILLISLVLLVGISVIISFLYLNQDKILPTINLIEMHKINLIVYAIAL